MQKAEIIGVKFKGILLYADEQRVVPPAGSICHNSALGYFVWADGYDKSLSRKYFEDFKYPGLSIHHFHIIAEDVVREGDWYVFQDSIIPTGEKVYKVYRATKIKLDWLKRVKATYFKIVASTNSLQGVPPIPGFLMGKILYRITKTNSIINI